MLSILMGAVVKMSDQNEFRDDEEVLESIRKTQEMMREPEGFNFEEVLRASKESWDKYHTERFLSYGFAGVIFDTVHRKDGWWSRLKMERSFKSLEDEVNHLHTCARCKQALDSATRAIEYLKFFPMIVSLEDGEKALKHLAKKNNMTEDEFRAWMGKTSEEIIREMNAKDKTD